MDSQKIRRLIGRVSEVGEVGGKMGGKFDRSGSKGNTWFIE
jgi:hypothetical protein